MSMNDQPDRQFYTNEIIRLSHSGTEAVQRKLVILALALAEVELLTVEEVGNQ